ncbi:unnamed protein product [[Actinomadura] parvosata subsp. kistnae]|uniref:hypothetical protein n=1 Tax=[Actinomadura] parvosata TaxID=1955412 RepID=UPI000D2AC293|nr:unnamed protein product [Actinomadura parvosata subsp. kistnae]
MDDPIKEHATRVYAADPLLAGQDELTARRGEDLLEVAGGIGLAAVERLDPGTLQSCWSPLVVHRLRARVAGPDPEAALGALLDQWLAMPRGDEPEQALSVVWPSRDTAPVRALAVRGFAPSPRSPSAASAPAPLLTPASPSARPAPTTWRRCHPCTSGSWPTTPSSAG